jgi:hypothetical protein
MKAPVITIGVLLLLLGAGRAESPGFDHQKSRFPLLGRHARLRCEGCHRPAPAGTGLVFRGTPVECRGCHARDDVHKGAAGQRCEACHQAAGFEQPVATGHDVSPERLGGAHDRVACVTCHGDGHRSRGPDRPWRGRGSLCVSCHQRDDIHHNSLGPRCSDCHTQRTFAGARFRHDTVGCTLRGVHRVLPCVDCHKGGNYAGLSPLCVSCHRDDAMRAAAAGVAAELHVQQTACTHCHNPVTFRLGAATRQSPPESVCQ